MTRICLVPFVAAVLLAVGCGGRNQGAAPRAAETGTQAPGATAQPTTQPQPPAARGATLGEAGARVTNACARLYVSLAGHDGKDHKEDVVAVAREIIARLR